MIIPKDIADRLRFKKPNGQEQHILPIQEIEPVPRPCEDCGAFVDRRLNIIFGDMPVPHWRVKCVTCDKHKNPVTGEFETMTTIQHNRLLKAKKSQDDK